MKTTPLAAKAVALLRGNHVYMKCMVPTPGGGRWAHWGRVPEFVWEHGIYSTRTGNRVNGFGKETWKELKSKKLLSAPAFFPSRYSRVNLPEAVYTLNNTGLTTFIIAAILDVVVQTQLDNEAGVPQ